MPPDDPSYTLRRVWLSPDQEQGYYYGFSNEGLWPLCHLAYVRPAFRASDWRAYEEVNAKFADVVTAESGTESPVILIQDFHFALLPLLLRKKIPRATIALFWHIPWPNAETFGVCPWKREVLTHMLSADILGFHTRYHCQNFLDTVDRFVECQIDREHMTVTLQGRVCRVAPYPISIEWPPRWLARLPDVASCRTAVRERYRIGADVIIGLGVERWDFTKGIIERFQALEVLLDNNPRHLGRISLLQVAAPSRGQLPAYQALQQHTYGEVERINSKFAQGDWRPIVLIDEHQPPLRVYELYRPTDFCLVNSLHDGMNLVAKEFVAARDDEDGVLILSTFAGASRELAGGGADQSLRCHGNRECHGGRDAHGPGRAAQPHEPDAPHGQGKQRVSLGRAHVDGRRAHPSASEPALHGAPLRHLRALANSRPRLRGPVRPDVRTARERAQPLCRRQQRFLALGDAQPHQRHARRLRVERRQRNDGDLRLADQAVCKLHVIFLTDRPVVHQLKIGAGRRQRLQS